MAASKSEMWRFTVKLPKAAKKIIQQAMLDNDIEEIQDVGEEALEMWLAAKSRGAKLPKSASPRQDQQTNGTEVLVNNAG